MTTRRDGDDVARNTYVERDETEPILAEPSLRRDARAKTFA